MLYQLFSPFYYEDIREYILSNSLITMRGQVAFVRLVRKCTIYITGWAKAITKGKKRTTLVRIFSMVGKGHQLLSFSTQTYINKPYPVVTISELAFQGVRNILVRKRQERRHSGLIEGNPPPLWHIVAFNGVGESPGSHTNTTMPNKNCKNESSNEVHSYVCHPLKI